MYRKKCGRYSAQKTSELALVDSAKVNISLSVEGINIIGLIRNTTSAITFSNLFAKFLVIFI